MKNQPWIVRRLEGLKRDTFGIFTDQGKKPLFKSKDQDGLQRIVDAHNVSPSAIKPTVTADADEHCQWRGTSCDKIAVTVCSHGKKYCERHGKETNCQLTDLAPPSSAASPATEVEQLLKEVMQWHADKESSDYNQCDEQPCNWCCRAHEILSETPHPHTGSDAKDLERETPRTQTASISKDLRDTLGELQEILRQIDADYHSQREGCEDQMSRTRTEAERSLGMEIPTPHIKANVQGQVALRGLGLIAFDAVELELANELLVIWGHKMGAINRGNQGAMCHCLTFEGRPVAVTTASPLIMPRVGNCPWLVRENTIELSRLCAERSGLCRVALRLWREFVFPSLGYKWAMSYQDADLHNGNTYRFDAWERVGRSRSGPDTRSGRAGRDKWIWAWPTREHKVSLSEKHEKQQRRQCPALGESVSPALPAAQKEENKDSA